MQPCLVPELVITPDENFVVIEKHSTYTLLNIKKENNKDLVYGVGNSAQRLVIIYPGKESERE